MGHLASNSFGGAFIFDRLSLTVAVAVRGLTLGKYLSKVHSATHLILFPCAEKRSFKQELRRARLATSRNSPCMQASGPGAQRHSHGMKKGPFSAEPQWSSMLARGETNREIMGLLVTVFYHKSHVDGKREMLHTVCWEIFINIKMNNAYAIHVSVDVVTHVAVVPWKPIVMSPIPLIAKLFMRMRPLAFLLQDRSR